MILKNYMFMLVLLVIMSSHSCKKQKENIPDDSLTLPLQPYLGNEIKMQGYYYYHYYTDASGVKKYSLYFFYRNGVVFGGIGCDDNTINDIETRAMNGTLYNQLKNTKYNWGRVNIAASSITFERWYPGEGPLRAYIRNGNIVDDSTFIITESYRMVEGSKTETTARNETYKFKYLTPKPDSTNIFTQN